MRIQCHCHGFSTSPHHPSVQPPALSHVPAGPCHHPVSNCTHSQSPPSHQALGRPAGVPAAQTPHGGIKPGTAWQHKTPLEPFWPLDPEATTWPPDQGRSLASGSLLFSLLSSKDKNKIPIISFPSSLMLISSLSLTSVPTAYQRIFPKRASLSML